MPSEPVVWSDDVEEIVAGDVVAAAAYTTPAGGVVLSSVAPCGLHDRPHGSIGFTTSLGLPAKLKRIVRDPKVSVAYHCRRHGFAISPRFVLAQGQAAVDLMPSPERLVAFAPQVERYLGAPQRGAGWDWWLREYYRERVFVDIAVRRVIAWPDLVASGSPDVFGLPVADPPDSQRPPKGGTAPRVDVEALGRRLLRMPHLLLGYRGGDGFPEVLPVEVVGYDSRGIKLSSAAGKLPVGQRRAGLLGHDYRQHLVGLSTRTCTGWLEVAPDATSAGYAPHTSKGFAAPPNKKLLLLVNGGMAKIGMWQARRSQILDELKAASPP